MLRDNFFSIIDRNVDDTTLKSSLSIRRDHPIFQGHFPGQPVVPGVCMVQMIKELLEIQMDTRLQLRHADSIKFLSIVDPDRDQMVEASVSWAEENGMFSVNASLFSGSVTFFKLKATFSSAA
jgi:3-hydroxyacyl-[acyl-carrier-protein] dehydratase